MVTCGLGAIYTGIKCSVQVITNFTSCEVTSDSDVR